MQRKAASASHIAASIAQGEGRLWAVMLFESSAGRTRCVVSRIVALAGNLISLWPCFTHEAFEIRYDRSLAPI